MSNVCLELAPVERSVFVAAMRLVAHSVGVVTTGDALNRHGATVTSFCSVSADPPTLLVCLRKGSRIADAVIGNESFNLNVLTRDMSHVAERFSGAEDAQMPDRFTGIEVTDNPPSPSPVIAGAEVFQCRMLQAVTEGSHFIVTGLVEAVADREALPLIYMDGAYRDLVERK